MSASEPQARTVSLGEIELNVSERGAGQPVLLLHGFPDSLRMWDGVAQRLEAEGFRVVAYDLRGFGGSSAPRGRRHYTSAAAVADAVGVIEALGLPAPLTVVGHDWGALHSWFLCLARPDLVARHVAIAVGHPLAYRQAGLGQKLKGWYVAAFQLPGVAEWLLSRHDFAAMRRFTAAHPDPQRWVSDMSRPGRLTAGISWYRGEALSFFTRRWPSCRVPTLGMFSTGDPYLVERQMTESRRHMAADWEYVRFDGAGHWLPNEQPAAVAELIGRWARG